MERNVNNTGLKLSSYWCFANVTRQNVNGQTVLARK